MRIERTQAERITALEVEVAALKQMMVDHVRDQRESRKSQDQKLDELLQLKNKGAGAFWLATALAGTGFLTVGASILDWLRGAFYG